MNALFITNVLVQIFLISMLFTKSAYHFAFSLAASAILYPYMFSAFYQEYTIEHKLTATPKQWIIGILASIYAIWLVYASGIDYLLLTMLLYIPGLSSILLFRKIIKSDLHNLTIFSSVLSLF